MLIRKNILTYLVLLILVACASAKEPFEVNPDETYGKYELHKGYTIIRGERYGVRPTGQDNMEFKWMYTPASNIGAVQVGDLNNDEHPEVLVGLDTGHIIVLDYTGHYLKQFYIGNSSEIGKIYSIAVSDIDNDGNANIIVGLGGARKVFTYSKTGYETSYEGAGSIEMSENVLYKVIRNFGGIFALDNKGRQLWNYTQPDSINIVKTRKIPGSDEDIIYAGMGERTIFTYNRFGDYTVRKRECYDIDVVNETTYHDEEHCTCENCEWYPDPSDPEGGECLDTYSYERCSWTEVTLQGWNLVDEPIFNGTLLVFDNKGELKASKEVLGYDENGNLLRDYDYNVRDIEFGDITDAKDEDIIIASDIGTLYAINQDNISGITTVPVFWQINISGAAKAIATGDLDEDRSTDIIAGNNNGEVFRFNKDGAVIWMQKVKDVITDIKIEDLEDDGITDIIVSSRDKKMYVMDPGGVIVWKQSVEEDLYETIITDFERNTLKDLISVSTKNITCYELSEFFVMRKRGTTLYEKAYNQVQIGDYTTAMIYVQKAKDIFEKIKDQDNIGRTIILIEKINEEFILYKKHEAEQYYQEALSYYSINDLEEAMKNAERAKKLYTDIEDEKGIESMDNFIEQIRKEKVIRKKMEADGLYTKALSFKTLRNYSQAIEYAKKARDIYEKIKYFNGTIKSDELVIDIGDMHYRNADRYFRAKDYKHALYMSNEALTYYNIVEDNTSIYKVTLLIERINNESNRPRTREYNLDYTMMLGIAIVILIIALVILRKRSSGKSKVISETPGDMDPLRELEKLEAIPDEKKY